MRLGLGFGTGAAKLQHTLKTSPPGADLPLATCLEFVQTWRSENQAITNFWTETESCLREFMAWPEEGKAFWLGKVPGVVEVTPEGFRFPNGLYMRYPGLWTEYDSQGRRQYMYTSRKGPQKTWGGSVTENLIQGLARIVVGEQMLRINKRFPVVLTVHDAAVIVVPEEERKAAVEFVTKIMSTPPAWGPTLPVACEASWGPSYGECLTDEQWNERSKS
jgi:DNA polymerase